MIEGRLKIFLYKNLLNNNPISDKWYRSAGIFSIFRELFTAYRAHNSIFKRQRGYNMNIYNRFFLMGQPIHQIMISMPVFKIN